MKRVSVVVVLVLLAGCSSLQQSLRNQPCELDAARPYDVIAVDPGQYAMRLMWKDADGEPFLTIDRVRAFVAARGDSLVAATNAGIYEPGFVPTGLYVENGTVLRPLNLADGQGNFYLKPNGVFYLTEGGDGHVVEASEYAGVDAPVRYATQSGPLLVRRGVIHTGFTPGSENCRLRSGVGVATDGTVYLAISNGAVNFHDFAAFFRDELGCPDALYLDGAISRLYAPSLNRREGARGDFAGILVVVPRSGF